MSRGNEEEDEEDQKEEEEEERVWAGRQRERESCWARPWGDFGIYTPSASTQWREEKEKKRK